MLDEFLRSNVLDFRVQELKSVLSQLGLPLTGRKQELQTRVFHYFGQSFAGILSATEAPKEEWKLQAASTCWQLGLNFNNTRLMAVEPYLQSQEHLRLHMTYFCKDVMIT